MSELRQLGGVLSALYIKSPAHYSSFRKLSLSKRIFRMNNQEDAMPLPSYTSLEMHFPAMDAAPVKSLLGGNVNKPWIQNVCVIRVSRALNLSGDTIPIARSGLKTLRGSDGRQYAIRVNEFRQYMRDKYGQPNYISGGGSPPASFRGRKGIIIFEASFSDATGHADLWNGSSCVYKCYWERATKVELWIAP